MRAQKISRHASNRWRNIPVIRLSRSLSLPILPEIDAAPLLPDKEFARIEMIAIDPGCDLFNTVNQALQTADPDSDVLILESECNLTSGALARVSKSGIYRAIQSLSLPPSRSSPGETRRLIPTFLMPSTMCRVMSRCHNHHRNVEAVPLFHSGGTIDLNFASFFCVYIKREIWDECSILGNEKGGDGQIR